MGLPGGGRPGRLMRGSISKKRQQTLKNIKLTLLCSFITVLVLRGTVGFNLLVSSGGSDGAEADAKVVEDIERILGEIRSDSEPDYGDLDVDASSNSTVLYSGSGNASSPWTYRNYTLGPKVTDWNAQRRQWMSRNPGFPSHDASGKPKILLVTGSPPGPCDNPMGDHYLLKATKNKIDYCRLHGIDIMYNMAHLDPELTGYWSKIPLLRRLMLAHPEVEWVWWVDSDAIFTDMAFELPLSRYEGRNLVIHGYPDLLFQKRSWISLNAGIFLLRNCQWSLDLLDAWVQMGPKGRVREEAGKLLRASLTGRPAFDGDDQSALIYLLLTEKEKWIDKVHIETEFYLHGFWTGLVDRYEEMMEKHHPGLGDDRWPFITHFVGCKTCGRYEDYPLDRCLSSMERAFNFADNQVLRLYGFQHRSLASPKVRRVAGRMANPVQAKEAALKMDAKFEST
ncbi:probable glycosyltransferase 3 [Phragmites australis]|uniref:probable glycosyltransferase 3 n=1 Tax=Phragmites australis TaxID=29695 RepID=UPI002D77CEAE|nr:probable glycosyltransferase 3 [Phragmites australis]